MSDDKDLKGFKISDLKTPQVRSFNKTVPAADKQARAAAEADSGFEHIEKLLESSTIEEVADKIRGTYEKLEEMAANGDMKSKASAQKAMIAYERTADLFEYLFATKESISQ